MRYIKTLLLLLFLFCTECNLECHNGGTLNEDECSCLCPDGWYGVDCRRKMKMYIVNSMLCFDIKLDTFV